MAATPVVSPSSLPPPSLSLAAPTAAASLRCARSWAPAAGKASTVWLATPSLLSRCGGASSRRTVLAVLRQGGAPWWRRSVSGPPPLSLSLSFCLDPQPGHRAGGIGQRHDLAGQSSSSFSLSHCAYWCPCFSIALLPSSLSSLTTLCASARRHIGPSLLLHGCVPTSTPWSCAYFCSSLYNSSFVG